MDIHSRNLLYIETIFELYDESRHFPAIDVKPKATPNVCIDRRRELFIVVTWFVAGHD